MADVNNIKNSLAQVIRERGENDPAGAKARELLDEVNRDPGVIDTFEFREKLNELDRSTGVVPYEDWQAFQGPRRPVVMPAGVGPGGAPVQTPQDKAKTQLQGNYSDWEREQGAANDWYQGWQYGTLRDREQNLNDWETGVQGQLDRLPGINQAQADARFGNTAGLRRAFEGYNASDLAATNDFINNNNASLGTFNTRMNDLYNASVPMNTAAQWSSNPQDIANQNQALGQFSNIYGGGLDYQAAQAQAKLAELYQYASDPTDVARQEAAIQELHGLINGGEWNEHLRDVTQKYKGLSDPEITAQERFILEQFTQRRQDLERANREAVLSEMAGRGLRSGAAEQTAMLNAQQELGRQSVLTELGAQANAIARSQQALQGWSQASQAGRQSQLAAQGMYVDAAGNLREMNDRVGMFNTSEANATSRYNAGLQTQTNQFNAQQTNNARSDNQATRLAGAQGFADQSNEIRRQNDVVGTFNTGQTNLINIQNQGAWLQDMDRKGRVADTQHWGNVDTGQTNLDARRSTNATNAGRDLTIHGAQQDDIGSWADNLRGEVGTNIGFQDQRLTNRNNLVDDRSAVGTELWGGVFTPTNTNKKLGKDKVLADQWLINSTRWG